MKLNLNNLLYPILLVGVFSLLAVGCKEDDTNSASQIPILTTTMVSEINANTVLCGGDITSDQGSEITERGVCWSLASTSSAAPTIANTKTIDGSGLGSFVSNVAGLTAYTTYYIRAYATNANGTGYGATIYFTTRKGIPVLTTSEVTEILSTSAKCGGNISYNGGDSITVSGVCWSTSETPTISDNVTKDTVSNGSFVNTLTNLKENTIYYVRAYATDSVGTGYGNIISFRTQQGGGILGFSTVDIPTGTFTMGSPTNEAERKDDESQYQVTIDAFKMSKYEITNAQYAAFLNSKKIGSDGKFPGGSYPSQPLIYESSENYNWGLNYTGGKWVYAVDHENYPVILVTWYGAVEYAKYTGGRLPSEAEWEYACRANTTTPFNTGDCLGGHTANYNWVFEYGNCDNINSGNSGNTQSVNTYFANAFGLFNMHGNVGEWCSNWYGDYPAADQDNPKGSITGSERVVRGGSWDKGAGYCRSASRASLRPEGYDYAVGFRVVKAP